MLDTTVFSDLFAAVYTQLQTVETGAIKAWALTFEPKNLREKKVFLTPAGDSPLSVYYVSRGDERANCSFVVSFFDRVSPGDDLAGRVAEVMGIVQAFDHATIGNAACTGATVPILADGAMLNESNIFFASVQLNFAVFD